MDAAALVKIDLLALGALSQMQQAVRLMRGRTGHEPDLSRIDYRDEGVFDDLGKRDRVGVFQVESAAQMQTIVRMRPRDIYELALEIAVVRPGVGAHDGIAEFVRITAAGAKNRFAVAPSVNFANDAAGTHLSQPRVSDRGITMVPIVEIRAATEKDRGPTLPNRSVSRAAWPWRPPTPSIEFSAVPSGSMQWGTDSLCHNCATFRENRERQRPI